MSSNFFEVENALYVGNFAVAVNKGASLQVSQKEDQLRRDILIYKAQIGMNEYDLVLSEIKEDADVELQMVRLLAKYLSDVDSRSSVVEKVNEIISNQTNVNSSLMSTAATIYLHEGDYKNALRMVHNPFTIEMASIQATTLLRMNRVDLAQQTLKKMQDMDDDSTLTQLVSAYIAMTPGVNRLKEAESIFDELEQRFGETVSLTNGRALCHMAASEFAEAEGLLLEALAKRSNDVDTLINLIVCAHNSKKSQDYINRYLKELKSRYPGHPWVKKINAAETMFDEKSAVYNKA
eukprot:gb/GECH01012446.1/.p1 GENE.gb/GECH01012446.1/~~gb/GECH01012446.1/.p1  ORF type:complete len:293 (+),score=79.87 gb/GECH01012446.1/:1-879(+)